MIIMIASLGLMFTSCNKEEKLRKRAESAIVGETFEVSIQYYQPTLRTEVATITFTSENTASFVFDDSYDSYESELTYTIVPSDDGETGSIIFVNTVSTAEHHSNKPVNATFWMKNKKSIQIGSTFYDALAYWTKK